MKKQSLIRKLMVLTIAALMCIGMIPSLAFAGDGSTINVKVNVEWLDDSVNGRPESLTIKLFRSLKGSDEEPTPVTSLETRQDGDGNFPEVTFKGLPLYDESGKEYEYSVNEASVPDSYTYTITGDQKVGFTVVNTQLTSVRVTKKWVGDVGSSATVHLLANGTEVESMTFPTNFGWTDYFSGLAKVDNEGNTIKYTVTEDEVKGYSSKITGNAKNGFTVINTKTISIPVRKVWYGDSAKSVTVHLFADGTEVGSATLTSDNDWSHTFTDLAQADSNGNTINYTLTEDEIDGYSSEVTGDASSGFKVTNVKTIDIPVKKIWNGVMPGDHVDIELLRDGKSAGTVLTLNENNNWEASFEDLPMYSTNDAHEYEYTVRENTTGYDVSITGDASSGFTVTNTKTFDIPVTKKWVGGTGESATVHLLANGTEVANATLNADNNWKYTFTNLDQVDSDGNTITYTLTEDAVSGYTSEVTGDSKSGFVVTNTKNVDPTPTPATVDIPVSKEWASGTTKNPVTVELLRNGSATGITMTLDEANGWKGTFAGQPEYDSTGAKYIYTVNEITDNYTWSVSGSADNGFVITNGTREVTAGDPPVRKIITGDTPSKDSTFYFTMTAEPEKSTLPTGMTEMPMPTAADGEQSMTTSVTGEGSGEFGDITFTEPGTYVYKVTEKNTGVKGYDYDDTVYEVRYVVTEADDSTTGEHNVLKCERTILKDGVVQSGMTFAFTNKYTSSSSSNDDQGRGNNDGNSGENVNGNNNGRTGQGSNSSTAAKNGSGISGNSSVSVVRTGDTSNVILWTVTLTVSAAAIAIGLFLRKRLSKKN